jgi:hypothetical protein
MAKPGRPNKNGVKPGWTLFRSFLALHAYDRARARGEKHSVAIAEAVSALRSLVPEFSISETEVRRVLAEFQSKDSAGNFIITEGVAQGPELQLWSDNLKWLAQTAEKFPEMLDASSFPGDEFDPTRIRTLTIQVGPRFRYPRHNARTNCPSRDMQSRHSSSFSLQLIFLDQN